MGYRRTMYPITNAQVRQSRQATLQASRLLRCSLLAVAAVTLSVARRATATCLSRSERRRDVAGKSGRRKREIIANPTVAAPSMINSQRHPRIPWTPSRPSTIPAAIKPPKAPDRTAADINTPKRFDCSACLYHDDRRSITPGANPASTHPRITRRATRWEKSLITAITQVKAPQRIMIDGRKIDGRDRPRARL